MRIFHIAKVDIKFTFEEYKVKHKHSKQMKYQNWSIISGSCLHLWMEAAWNLSFTFANILTSFIMISLYVYPLITQFLAAYNEIFCQ